MPTADSTNSFVTVAEMDAYFDTQINRYLVYNAIADEEDKDRMAIEATSILLYQVDWLIVIDKDNPGDLDSDYLTTVQLACYELIWHIFLSDRQLESESKGIKKMKLDVLEIENDKTDRRGVIPSHVTYIIRDLISSSAGSMNIPTERE